MKCSAFILTFFCFLFYSVPGICETSTENAVVDLLHSDANFPPLELDSFSRNDVTPPVLAIAASDLTVESDGNGNINDLNSWLLSAGGAEATDDSGGSITWTNNYSAISDACCETGSAVVFFTATDESGNSATLTSAIFTIEDTQPPVFAIPAQDFTVECDGQGNLVDLNDWLDARGYSEALDMNCGQQLTWSDDYTDICVVRGHTGSATVTFSVLDNCGNLGRSTATFTILDSSPPSLLSPASDLYIETDGEGNLTELDYFLDSKAGAIADDQCSNVMWINTFLGMTSECGTTGTTLASECSSTTIILKLRTDNFPGETSWKALAGGIEINSPVYTCQNAEYVEILTFPEGSAVTFIFYDTGGNGFESQSGYTIKVAGGNNCTSVSGGIFGNSESKVIDLGPYTIPFEGPVTFIGIDSSGNCITPSATFTIEDNIAPEWIVPPSDKVVEFGFFDDEDGLDNWLDNYAEALVEDMGGDAFVSYELIDFYTKCSEQDFTYNYLFRATDECGNFAESHAAYHMDDNTPPEIIALWTDITINCDEDIYFDKPYAEDICDSDINLLWAWTDSQQPGSCPNQYSVSRHWKVWDGCQNESYLTQTIHVQDTVPPTLIIASPELAGYSNGDTIPLECGQVPNYTGDAVVAQNNCGEPTPCLVTVDNISAGDCNIDGYTHRCTFTWTAVDRCGNESSFSLTFESNDTEAPEFLFIPLGDTTSCPLADDWVWDDPLVSDNCSAVWIDIEDDQTPGDCVTTSYCITRTWRLTDACGNTNEASATVCFIAASPDPVFTDVPQSVLLSCGDPIPEFGDPTVTSSCGLLTITYEDEVDDLDCSEVQSYTRTWTAIDECGNSSTAVQAVMIDADNIPPSFQHVPPNKSISCGDAFEFGNPILYDNCSDGDDLVIITEDIEILGNCIYSNSKTRQWKVIDLCGNMSVATQTITMSDMTPPSFETIPEDKVLYCGEEPEFETLTATDECGQVTISYEDFREGVNCVSGYAVTRVWTAIDECGNIATLDQEISVVQDAEPPVFVEVPQSSIIDCSSTIEFGTPIVEDSCPIELTFEDETIDGSCTEGYTFIRTWTAQDACGNTSVASQEFTIEQDLTAPTFSAVPAEIDLECGELMDDEWTPIATDICNEVEVVYKEISINGTGNLIQTITRQWVATDECGNSSELFQKVFVRDTEAPTFDNESIDQTMTLAIYENWEVPTITAYDNCGQTTIAGPEIIAHFQDCENGYYEYIWTATDEVGNTNSLSSQLVISDYIPEIEINFNADYNCQDQIDLDIDRVGGVGPFEYQWEIINGTEFGWSFQNDIDKSSARINPGLGLAEVEVSVRDANGCVFSDVVELACSSQNIDVDLQLSPVPANDELVISFEREKSGPYTITVYDLLGQAILKIEGLSKEGMNTELLSVYDLAAANYILEVDFGEERIAKKFVKITNK